PMGIIFAFDSRLKPQTIMQHWRRWNVSKNGHYRTDMICILKKQTLIVDNTRFPRLVDDNVVIMGKDMLATSGQNKLVAIKTPEILFYFFSLLLRGLRQMSAFSSELVSTTYMRYLKSANMEILHSIDADNRHFDNDGWLTISET